MKRLYNDRLSLTEEGKELLGLISDKLSPLLNEWLEMGYHPHDIQRVAEMASTAPTLIFSMKHTLGSYDNKKSNHA